MQELFITENKQLEELCTAWSGQPWLGLDTEFLRIRTYYPKLCLLQVATCDQIALIDPTGDLSLAPLCHLFSTTNTIKIIHAARQDIEVLFPVCHATVGPVFDTQIAAGILGLGDQIGYAALVEMLVGVRLPKGHTRADWCQRPLPPAQRQYAVDDVRYLGVLYQTLTEQLRAKDRESWCQQECEQLSDFELYNQDPALAYKRTRIGASLPIELQPVLKELAVWREHTAQRRDLPRNWIADDRLLAEVARQQPKSESALRAVEGVTDKFMRHNADEVLELLNNSGPRQPELVWRAQSPLSGAQQRSCDQLMRLVREVASKAGIAAPLLATRRDIESFVRGNRQLAVLSGWRKELVGDQLQAYLSAQSQESSTTNVSS